MTLLPSSFQKIFYPLLKPYRHTLFAIVCISTAFGLALSFASHYLITDQTSTAVLSLIACTVVLVLRSASALLSDFLALNIYASARQLVTERVFKKMRQYREKWSSGEILDRFYGDLYNLFDAAAFSAVQIASQAVILTVSFFYLASTSYLSLIYVALGGLFYLSISITLKPFLQRHIATGRLHETRLFTLEKNFVEGYDYLKTSGYFSLYLQKLNQTVGLWLKNEKSKYSFTTLGDTLSWAVRYIFVVLILGAMTTNLGLPQKSLYWVFIAVGAISQLFWSFHNLMQAKPHFNRCQMFFDDTQETSIEPTHSNLFEIQVRELKINLDPRQQSRQFIGPFQFTWVQGDRVWVKGPSGCGKTTLIRCLLGLTPKTSGTIDLPPTECRMGYVEQDPFFFDNETLAVNLGVSHFDELDSDAIIHLDLTHFFANMPHGLNTVIGKEGVMPSKGQRMRLALLRALSKKPHLLFIDEPSAGLETGLAIKLLGYVKQKMSNGILIVADHREDIMQSLMPTITFDFAKYGKATKSLTASPEV